MALKAKIGIAGALILIVAICFGLVRGQTTPQGDWRISPEEINIQVGDRRTLQVLDDIASEVHGARWSVDDANIAHIQETSEGAVIEAKGTGVLQVTASIGSEKR